MAANQIQHDDVNARVNDNFSFSTEENVVKDPIIWLSKRLGIIPAIDFIYICMLPFVFTVPPGPGNLFRTNMDISSYVLLAVIVYTCGRFALLVIIPSANKFGINASSLTRILFGFQANYWVSFVVFGTLIYVLSLFSFFSRY